MKCASCPVRDGLPCRGETHRFGDVWPFCRDVEAGLPGRAEQMVALAEPGGPGLAAMVAGFAGAVAAHVADGGRMAPEEVREARKAICDRCAHFEPPDRCAACGCGLTLKRSWASSRCPLDPPKWDRV